MKRFEVIFRFNSGGAVSYCMIEAQSFRIDCSTGALIFSTREGLSEYEIGQKSTCFAPGVWLSFQELDDQA